MSAMGKSATNLTELQFTILDGMADDFENIEQLYLCANRAFTEEKRLSIEHPQIVLRVRFPLHEIIDEIAYMLREGYIHAKYSSDEQLASLGHLNFSALHHYWFGATERGAQAWKAYPADESLNK